MAILLALAAHYRTREAIPLTDAELDEIAYKYPDEWTEGLHAKVDDLLHPEK
ncbi:MAG: hypothetical protein JSS44_08005 [Proteobacteria bacterium]|nr:hypothetical protein [Pseudomonadota bacterium]MBS0462047.1 hypothetical protein [Pseudomonadota bacterium]